MSVVVKGMRMPENCNVCRFSDWSNLHQTVSCKLKDYKPCFSNYSTEYITQRSTICPLVDLGKHGDLIDRNALEQEMLNGIKAGNLEEGYEMYANINTVDDCVECVRWADAVIEAEEES